MEDKSMEKVLDLVLIGKWYDLIADGIKTEEYRAVTPFWCNRILKDKGKSIGYEYWEYLLSVFKDRINVNNYELPTHVRFRRGYTNISITYKIESITIGIGKSEWGAGADPCFIIKFK